MSCAFDDNIIIFKEFAVALGYCVEVEKHSQHYRLCTTSHNDFYQSFMVIGLDGSTTGIGALCLGLASYTVRMGSVHYHDASGRHQ